MAARRGRSYDRAQRPGDPALAADHLADVVAGDVQLDDRVAVALDLLDEAGLDGLTLRQLAGRLGIRAPTLYWHVRDKRELLDLLAGAVMDEALAGWREPRPGQP